MENAWSAHDQTYARPPCQIAVGACGIACGLLVTKGDEAYAEVDGFLSDVNDGNSHQSKDDGDSKAVERACYDLAAAYRWGGRHRETQMAGEDKGRVIWPMEVANR